MRVHDSQAYRKMDVTKEHYLPRYDDAKLPCKICCCAAELPEEKKKKEKRKKRKGDA